MVNLGLIDSPPAAFEAGHRFRKEDVDLIFLHVTTYALSATVLPVVQRARVPVVVLNLQPAPAIDYESFNRMRDRTQMTGEWLAHCGACPVPEIANVFRRARIDFHQITGLLDDDPVCWNEVDAWIDAARVAHVLFHNRLGVMGHYYGGMLDIYSDLTQHSATLRWPHRDARSRRARVALPRRAKEQVDARVAEFRELFDVQPDCEQRELERAARTSVALDRLVAERNLGSLAYYYKGTGVPENEDVMSSIILGNSLLTARGIPVAGEYEVKNVQAMKILDTFGVGGSFTEYLRDGLRPRRDPDGARRARPHGDCRGKIKVRPLGVYHGKVGSGLSVEMSVKHGPVTLLSVVERGDGPLSLLVAEGESVPGPILEIGNTNSRYRFGLGARQFVNAWNSHAPAHHCAVGVGHIADRIVTLGKLLRIEVNRVLLNRSLG